MAPKDASGDGSSKPAKYTWQEVATHTSEDDMWVYANNKVYDVTDWVHKHPGGKEMLLLVAGRDVTDVMDSYHPFTDKANEVLAKYYKGELVGGTEHIAYKPDSGFYKELRSKVGEYFKKNNLNYKDPMPGLIRLFWFFLIAAITFKVAYTSSFPMALRMIAAAIFGVCQALPLLHCMHDASHTAIGNSPSMWKWIGILTLDIFGGASIASWHNQHIVGHHIYTNVMGADPDLPVAPKGDIRRVVKSQWWTSVYKYQHVYLPLLYGLLGMKFRVQDIVGMTTRSNGPIRVNPLSWELIIRQVVVKSLFVCWRLLMPVLAMGMSWSQTLGLFLIMEFATGWYLAFNFQVSHVSPGADFFAVHTDKLKGISQEWAVSQVMTSVDYAHDSWLVALLAGALNYQVVHHLLPSVSQYHYPAIAPIVKDVCKKWNVPYPHLPDFQTAFGKHIEHLKTLGWEAVDKDMMY